MIWKTFLYYPLLNLLIIFYKIFLNNMGMAIIVLTLLSRFALLPVTKSQLDSIKKQKEIAPLLDKIKKKYSKDKKKLAEAQMELYKKYNINPAKGCLTPVIQVVFIFALLGVFREVIDVNGSAVSKLNEILYFDYFKFAEDAVINVRFLYLDLSKPDPYLILPILAGIAQFFTSKLSLPRVRSGEKLAKKTVEAKDDVMYNMQEQMLYIFPLMTVFFGWKLPAGIVLYWFVTTAFSLVLQIIVNKKYEK